jgi:hypothetical protein
MKNFLPSLIAFLFYFSYPGAAVTFAISMTAVGTVFENGVRVNTVLCTSLQDCGRGETTYPAGSFEFRLTWSSEAVIAKGNGAYLVEARFVRFRGKGH